MTKPEHVLFIGRFQPFHLGHEMIIRSILEVGNIPVIGIKGYMNGGQKENPYTYEERVTMIRKIFGDEVEILQWLPDIKEFLYGRNVGYKIRQVKLHKNIEEISATKIRENRKWK
ncbi:MAG: adenylyltransferase/cytidyltransferase family protein [archaeon]